MDKPFEVLLQNGILGAVTVLSVMGLIFLFRALQTSHASRIQDLLDFKQTIDANTRSNEQVADAVKTLGEKVERQAERRSH